MTDHDELRRALDEWSTRFLAVAEKEELPFSVLSGPAITRTDPENDELVTYTTAAWKDSWDDRKYGNYLVLNDPTLDTKTVLQELKKSWQAAKKEVNG